MNITYGIREIQDRVTPGSPREYQLAPGPDGRVNGSYKFSGSSNSYIVYFNGVGGALDVRYSFTILCWVNHNGTSSGHLFKWTDNGCETTFFQVSESRELVVVLLDHNDQTYSARSDPNVVLSEWKFVGASYNGSTGETKLWIDGVAVQTENITAGLHLQTSGNVEMGISLKGMMTQMRLYNVSLSQEQIQEIMQGKSALQILQLK